MGCKAAYKISGHSTYTSLTICLCSRAVTCLLQEISYGPPNEKKILHVFTLTASTLSQLQRFPCIDLFVVPWNNINTDHHVLILYIFIYMCMFDHFKQLSQQRWTHLLYCQSEAMSTCLISILDKLVPVIQDIQSELPASTLKTPAQLLRVLSLLLQYRTAIITIYYLCTTPNYFLKGKFCQHLFYLMCFLWSISLIRFLFLENGIVKQK